MISIYIHWPFCLAKCPYCDFNSHVSNRIDHNVWLQNYLDELKVFLPVLRNRKIKSIFFGGGTPSLMEVKTVEGVLDFIRNNCIVQDDIEITLEMNPTSIEIEKLQDFSKVGINRVSIGIQSLNDKSLQFLGRNHSAAEALKCLGYAHKYFKNVSFDLIYGLPHQSLEQWKEECELAMLYVTNHVSLYQLMIEPNTKFYSLYKAGKLIPLADDVMSDMYDYTNTQLNQRGLYRYEISNYAKKGYESKHNLVYWNYDEYIGIGPGAHSRLLESDFIYDKYICLNDLSVKEEGQRARYNIYAMDQISNPQQWLGNVKQRTNILQVSRVEVAKEMIMMSLRTIYGLSLDKFYKYTGINLLDKCKDLILAFSDSNLLIVSNNIIILTDKGMAINSYIVREFFNLVDRC